MLKVHRSQRIWYAITRCTMLTQMEISLSHGFRPMDPESVMVGFFEWFAKKPATQF